MQCDTKVQSFLIPANHFPFTFPTNPTIYKKTKTRYQLDLITQQESLDAIFIYALQSVLRFRYGRKVLQWEDLFRCGVR